MIYTTTEDYISIAGLPSNWCEDDLQHYLSLRLEKYGYEVKRETWHGKPVKGKAGRSDIIAYKNGKKYLFEVKKYLNRGNLYQSLGQCICYKHDIPDLTNIVLIGFLPDGESDRESAMNTASYIKETNKKEKVGANVGVIFLNTHYQFTPIHIKNISEETLPPPPDTDPRDTTNSSARYEGYDYSKSPAPPPTPEEKNNQILDFLRSLKFPKFKLPKLVLTKYIFGKRKINNNNYSKNSRKKSKFKFKRQDVWIGLTGLALLSVFAQTPIMMGAVLVSAGFMMYILNIVLG